MSTGLADDDMEIQSVNGLDSPDRDTCHDLTVDAIPHYKDARLLNKAGVREVDMCHKAKMKDVDLATADAGEPRLCHVAQIDDMRMPTIVKCAVVKESGRAGG